MQSPKCHSIKNNNSETDGVRTMCQTVYWGHAGSTRAFTPHKDSRRLNIAMSSPKAGRNRGTKKSSKVLKLWKVEASFTLDIHCLQPTSSTSTLCCLCLLSGDANLHSPLSSLDAEFSAEEMSGVLPKTATLKQGQAQSQPIKGGVPAFSGWQNNILGRKPLGQYVMIL